MGAWLIGFRYVEVIPRVEVGRIGGLVRSNEGDEVLRGMVWGGYIMGLMCLL